jgi:hypothetical protein
MYSGKIAVPPGGGGIRLYRTDIGKILISRNCMVAIFDYIVIKNTKKCDFLLNVHVGYNKFILLDILFHPVSNLNTLRHHSSVCIPENAKNSRTPVKSCSGDSIIRV